MPARCASVQSSEHGRDVLVELSAPGRSTTHLTVLADEWALETQQMGFYAVFQAAKTKKDLKKIRKRKKIVGVY